MRALFATIVALLVLASLYSPGLGAEAPNFSGTWVLDRSQSARPMERHGGRDGEMALVIDQKGDTLTLERRVEVGGEERSWKTTYYTDGR